MRRLFGTSLRETVVPQLRPSVNSRAVSETLAQRGSPEGGVKDPRPARVNSRTGSETLVQRRHSSIRRPLQVANSYLSVKIRAIRGLTLRLAFQLTITTSRHMRLDLLPSERDDQVLAAPADVRAMLVF